MKKLFVAAVTAGISFLFIIAPQPLQRSISGLPANISLLKPTVTSARSKSNITAQPATAMVNPLSGRAWQKLAGIYSKDVLYASNQTGVSRKLLAAVIHVESRASNVVSYAGAVGPMQLMPSTAWRILHVNPWKPRQNIVGGARYLRRLLAIFHGHLRLALEAYNAGPTTVAQGVIPIPAKVYARQVMALAA
ncbi:lytic transglycosylase domain-containing protein [Acidithiobacillus sulfurivorans]|uniref:Lytic transglycosylase domain-containing protein n=1 Tax=Acidithiobacillus sulfurivorans TaxID=1958756 RepID=A0ABS5ZWW4_9PROT|nr:lytic transglycosylase domain-containing protein [Acidithiobacillus sulfurivorans]MBU2759169.1 lytic transglycosylase domain-containing protein [Acidithiobacillus sulfurivorans]